MHLKAAWVSHNYSTIYSDSEFEKLKRKGKQFFLFYLEQLSEQKYMSKKKSSFNQTTKIDI